MAITWVNSGIAKVQERAAQSLYTPANKILGGDLQESQRYVADPTKTGLVDTTPRTIALPNNLFFGAVGPSLTWEVNDRGDANTNNVSEVGFFFNDGSTDHLLVLWSGDEETTPGSGVYRNLYTTVPNSEFLFIVITTVSAGAPGAVTVQKSLLPIASETVARAGTSNSHLLTPLRGAQLFDELTPTITYQTTDPTQIQINAMSEDDEIRVYETYTP